MTTNNETLARLRSELEAARRSAAAEPTHGNRERAKAAWSALDAASPRRKTSGFASRAGKRQAGDRKALRGSR